MSRSGPTGQPGMTPPVRRTAADDLLRIAAQSAAYYSATPHWPPPRTRAAGPTGTASSHFPQPDTAPAYGGSPAQVIISRAGPGESWPFPSAKFGAATAVQSLCRARGPGSQLRLCAGGWQPDGSVAPPWGQQADPQGYDLGSYMSAAAPGYAPAEPDPYQRARRLRCNAQESGPLRGPQGLRRDRRRIRRGSWPRTRRSPPSRGRRGLMIAAALVGAIGLGGAMAYTYKTLFPSRGRPAR